MASPCRGDNLTIFVFAHEREIPRDGDQTATCQATLLGKIRGSIPSLQISEKRSEGQEDHCHRRLRRRVHSRVTRPRGPLWMDMILTWKRGRVIFSVISQLTLEQAASAREANRSRCFFFIAFDQLTDSVRRVLSKMD